MQENKKNVKNSIFFVPSRDSSYVRFCVAEPDVEVREMNLPSCLSDY